MTPPREGRGASSGFSPGATIVAETDVPACTTPDTAWGGTMEEGVVCTAAILTGPGKVCTFATDARDAPGYMVPST